MLGDFNLGHGHMVMETTHNPASAFNGFQMAGYYGDDVMGVLTGRQATQTGARLKEDSPRDSP